jgi:hypothetical protein
MWEQDLYAAEQAGLRFILAHSAVAHGRCKIAGALGANGFLINPGVVPGGSAPLFRTPRYGSCWALRGVMVQRRRFSAEGEAVTSSAPAAETCNAGTGETTLNSTVRAIGVEPV